MAKGGDYEREFSKLLSLWWSGGERDDLFWRSQASGGRARVRSRKGKVTNGQHSDIASTDPSSRNMTRVFTIELKRGYNKVIDVMGVLLKTGGNSTWTEWLEQASSAAAESGSKYWMVVHRKDHSLEALVYVPTLAAKELYERGGLTAMNSMIRIRHPAKEIDVTCMTLDVFLARVTPEIINEMEAGMRHYD